MSLYPTEDDELELNQIDFLRDRLSGPTIGFSTHEYHDWNSSMLIAYAKGARTFERHIDIEADGVEVRAVLLAPEQIDEWFKAFQKAKEMCGAPGTAKRIPPPTRDRVPGRARARGVRAPRPRRGEVITDDDVYLAVPLRKGQMSCRELIAGEQLTPNREHDRPIIVQDISGPYSRSPRCERRSRSAASRHERCEAPPRSTPTSVGDWLVELGYTHCFFVAGGNVMHLLYGGSHALYGACRCVPRGRRRHRGRVLQRDRVLDHAFALVTAGPGVTNVLTAMARCLPGEP